MTPSSGRAAAVPRPITLLVNGHSRRGRASFAHAAEALQRAGVPLGATILADTHEETERVLRREIEHGAHTIIVGGGDGTLSLCAGTLVGTSVAMGVLPMGTGNTLVRSLGIPLDLEAAAQTIAAGHVDMMDVGRVNDRVFLNSVSLGLSAAVAHSLNPQIKRRLGEFAWPIMGVRLLTRHRARILKISSAEQTFHVRTHQLLVSNGRYVAGAVSATPDASVQDGHLRVFVLGGSRVGSLMRATFEWLTGKHLESSRSRYFITKEVKVEALHRPARADVDGELNESTPLHLKVEPRALRVIVPQGFRADKV